MLGTLESIALLAPCLTRLVLADDSQNTTLCGTSDFYNSTTLPLGFNNNAWGDDGSGFSCTRINDDGTSFAVTYKWTGDAATVKGFPYAKTWANLPTALWNVSALEFKGKWRTYVQGTQDGSPEEQTAAYDAVALKVNAAIDMFLSDNADNSTGLNPPIEIMVWPWYTSNPQILPLGYAESTPDVDTVEAAGMNFSLYHGWNEQGQHVFSWLAQKNMTSLDGDVGPLLKYVWKKGLLSGALYVGQLEFGSEIMHAAEETVFEARVDKMRLIRQGDPDDPAKTGTTLTATPTASRTAPASQSTASSNVAPALALVGPGPGPLSLLWTWVSIVVLTTVAKLFIEYVP